MLRQDMMYCTDFSLKSTPILILDRFLGDDLGVFMFVGLLE